MLRRGNSGNLVAQLQEDLNALNKAADPLLARSSPAPRKPEVQRPSGQPDACCRDLLREFDPLISPQHIAVWRDNHHIVYPS